MKLRYKWIDGAKTLCYSSDGAAWFAVPSDEPPPQPDITVNWHIPDHPKISVSGAALDTISLAARATMEAIAKMETKGVMEKPKRRRGLGPQGKNVISSITAPEPAPKRRAKKAPSKQKH